MLTDGAHAYAYNAESEIKSAAGVNYTGVYPERSRRNGDFYPFGGERIVTNTCTQNYKFEGKERDTETGNDDFGARYYTSRLGR